MSATGMGESEFFRFGHKNRRLTDMISSRFQFLGRNSFGSDDGDSFLEVTGSEVSIPRSEFFRFGLWVPG